MHERELSNLNMGEGGFWWGLLFNSISSVTPSLLTNISKGGLWSPPLKRGGLLPYVSEKGRACVGGGWGGYVRSPGDCI